MSKDVTIGTGLNGWGYLNRLLYLSKEETVLLDYDEGLIRQLRKGPSYTIHFGSEQESPKVDSYTAYTITDECTITNIVQTGRIFIYVGASHVTELLPFSQAALQKRDRRSLDILVTENGIQPSSPLAVLRSSSRIHLSEAVIFCITPGQRDSLATFSGNLDHLPYDSIALGYELPLYDFIQEAHFSDLLEHKVYTYNCISACITYLEYRKGCTGYTEATNDVEITKKIKRIAEVINHCITTMYNVSMQEQTAFSEMTIRKSQDRDIKDTVVRNVRNIERKLKPKGRIHKPLSLIQEQGEYGRELLEVLAAILRYDIKTKEFSWDWDKLVDFYTQGTYGEWKQILHCCKWLGYKASVIRMKAAGSLKRKV